jgi:hypothetical protein
MLYNLRVKLEENIKSKIYNAYNYKILFGLYFKKKKKKKSKKNLN